MDTGNQNSSRTGATLDQPGVSSILRRLARDSVLREAAYKTTTLSGILAPALKRFIAGPRRSDAMEVADRFDRGGINSSIEFMGEELRDDEEIERTVTEYLDLLSDVANKGIQRNLSINLSHVGLTLSPELAVENLRRILVYSKETETEIILNMEGDRYRKHILEAYFALGSEFENLGITLQACLKSSRDNLEKSMRLPGRVRLVKGAYDELAEVHGDLRNTRVDRSYSELMTVLIEAGHPCAIATHDSQLINAALQLAANESPDSSFEVEFLLGVDEDYAIELKGRNVSVRMYVPYGYDWYVYLCHRLAEHPPNLYQALSRYHGERGTEPS